MVESCGNFSVYYDQRKDSFENYKKNLFDFKAFAMNCSIKIIILEMHYMPQNIAHLVLFISKHLTQSFPIYKLQLKSSHLVCKVD